MQQAKQILSKHWYKATGKQIDELNLNHLQYAVDAIAEALRDFACRRWRFRSRKLST